MRPPIPDDVHRFVLTSIASVPLLEALLLLRANPTLTWSAVTLAQRLFVNPAVANELLSQLCESGLAAPTDPVGSFRWNPDSPVAHIVDKLAGVYAVNVVDVTGLIHARQERRAIRFADAFRLRKKQE
jgi:hypothetical protein